MIISTCGFGSTGSSAITDFLKECEGTCIFDDIEFDIATMPDGLEDLEYHLMMRNSREKSGIYALQRFQKNIDYFSSSWAKLTKISKKEIKDLTKQYIESLAQVEYYGFSPSYHKRGNTFFRRYFGYSIVLQRLVPLFTKLKLINTSSRYYPLEKVYLSIKPDNFYANTRRYVKELMSKMGADFSKIIVMDQAFSGDNPEKSFPFFDDPYAIVVDRDPRDVYIFAKEKLKDRGRFMPLNTVDDFIIYYKKMRDNEHYTVDTERVLHIKFEDLVYDYENTAKRITSFTHLQNVSPKTIFVPEMSVANTNLIKKFPKYKEDIEKIEKELSPYLFNFEKYKDVKNDGKMFFGKSPLNK